MALYLQFISRGVAARSLQDALIWLLGLAPKRVRLSPHCLWAQMSNFLAWIIKPKQIICDIWQMLVRGLW
jgi:hypothetical protein